MSGLRESKKQATRAALADAAARQALEKGAEGMIVADIAAAAGVSPRTFHNYFGSASEALLHFTRTTVEEFSRELPTLRPELGIPDLMESIFIDSVECDSSELRSIPTLFVIADVMENLTHTPQQKRDGEALGAFVVETLRHRVPDKSSFEASVIIATSAAAGGLAMKELARRRAAGDSPSLEEQKNLIHSAFAALRGIGQDS